MRHKLILLLAGLAFTVQAGKLVVHNDEWVLAEAGFANAGLGATSTYAMNLANYFAGGGPGNFLVYSNNFGLTGPTLSTTITDAGHSWTIDNGFLEPFTAANLAGYDGVFLAGAPGNYSASEAVAYINAGGAIYIAAGTGVGGAAAEAAQWNGLLGAFGLALAPVYNEIGGNIAISSAHPVLNGVTQLFQNNGNTVSLTGGNPNASIILTPVGSNAGLIGVYDSGNEVPEPGTYMLLASGLGVLLLRRRLG